LAKQFQELDVRTACLSGEMTNGISVVPETCPSDVPACIKNWNLFLKSENFIDNL
jgi:hypothetical protein